MDFATLVLTADTKGLKPAEPALDALVTKAGKAEAAVKKLGTSTTTMGTGARKAAADAKTASTALDAIEADARQAAAALQQTQTALNGVGMQSKNAAGSVGNLGAQVFDIGMMMQAGQNPFQLMLQQGSQVAQIMGPMGASGAVAALKATFVSLLSPVNLAVFAIIGVTAALVPMVVELFKGRDAAAELAEKTEALAASVDAYRAAVEAANQPVAEMLASYGQLSAEAQAALDRLEEFSRAGAIAAMQEQADALALSFGRLEDSLFGFGASEAASRLYSEFGLSAEAALSLRDALQNLAQAEGPTEVARAAEALDAALIAAFGSAEAIPQPIQELREELAGSVVKAAEVQGAIDESAGAADALRAKVEEIGSALSAAASADLASVFQNAFPAASQLLGMARGVLATMNAARTGAAALKSAETAGLAAQYAQYGAGREAFNSAARESSALYTPYDTGSAAGGGSGGRSGAASEAEKQAAAIDKVIASLRSEMEAVGATTEARRLQQELQKAGVTLDSTEGQQIATLVEELTQLEAQQKLVADTMKGIENATQGFFVSVLSGAKDLKTALGDVAKQLGDLFLNQAFQMLWGGGGGMGGGLGGLLAGLFDAGGRIPAGQIGVVGEKRPEFVDGKLVTRPTLIEGPANVTGGAATARMLDRASAPDMQVAMRPRSQAMQMPAPRVTVQPAQVVVLDDPRKIDAWARSPDGERSAARQQRRLGNG